MHAKLTNILHDFLLDTKQERISFGEILTAFDELNVAVILLIFALPIFIPLPPPLPSIIAFPLILIALQLLAGRKTIWLPRWLTQFSFSRVLLHRAINFALPYITKLENKMQPRYPQFFTRLGKRVIGLICLIFAIVILIPLPFTNLLPGLAIICISIGLIGEDGMVVLTGLAIGFLGIGLTLAALSFGVKILTGALLKIQQYFGKS